MNDRFGRARAPKRVERRAEEASDNPASDLRNDPEEVNRWRPTYRNFVSAVWHELSQPLTVLRGSLELALEKERSAEDRRAWLEQALEQADRLMQLTSSLRELAEAENPGAATEKASLSVLVNEVTREMRPLAEVQGLHLIVQCENDLDVAANARRLQQALVNLISNAINHSPAGGTVRVSLGRSGRDASLTISDMGPGVSREELTRIFNPFYHAQTTPRDMDRNALGLAIGKRIIEAVNGTIRVESEGGQGRCFLIRLPLALA